MKYLMMLVLALSFNVWSQEKEGDLQMPVTDLTEIERQEEEVPTIDEVEVRQKKPKTEKKDISKKEKKTKLPEN